MATRVIAAQDKTSSGAGDDVQIKAGNANTSGAGGSIIIQPGAQATTGGNGLLIVRQPSGVAGTDEIQLSHDGGKGSVINKDGVLQLGGSHIALRTTANNAKTNLTAGTIYCDGLYSSNIINADGQTNDSYGWAIDGNGPNWNQGFNLRVGWSHIKGYANFGLAYTGDNTNGKKATLELTDGSTGGGAWAYRSSTTTVNTSYNDLNLAGHSAFQRLNATAATTITGIAPASTAGGGVSGQPTWVHTDGRVFWLYNVGTFNITIVNESASSTAGNRITTQTGANVVLGPGRMMQIVYDGTSSRWRTSGETYPYVFPTTDGTNGQVLTTNGSGTLSWATVSAGASASGTTNYIAKFTGTSTLGNSLIFDNGTNVGIGTATPGAKLEIQTADGADALAMSGYKTMKWESNNHLVYGGYSAGQWQVLKFYTNGSERIRVDATGNVGIGTTSPLGRLDVVGANVYEPIRGITDSASNLESGSNNTLGLSVNNSNTTAGNGIAIGFNTATTNSTLYGVGAVGFNNLTHTTLGVPQGKFQVITRDSGGGLTPKLTIDTSGNVGIGNTAPGTKLEVTGTVRSAASSTAGVLEVGSDGGLTLTRDNSYDLTLAQSSSSSNGLYLSGAGNVYVCIDNNNNEADRKFIVSNNAVKATNELFSVNESGVVYASGNVGLGTSSPANQLHLHATEPRIQLTTIAGGATYSDGAWIGMDATGLYFIEREASSIRFLVNSSSEAARITSTGNVGVGTTSPGAKLQVDTGATGTKGQIIKAFLGQSANLSEWQDSTGTVLASIDSAGRMTLAAGAAASNADLYFNNTASVNPGIKWNTVSGLTGLRFYSGATLVGAFQDNGFCVTTAGFATYGGMNYGSFTIYRTGGASINFNASGAAISVSAGSLTTADSTMQITTPAASKKGLVIAGVASQTGNLTEWQDSTGTVVAAVSPTGAFTGSSFTPYGTFNSTTTIFGNNYWTPNYTGGVTSPSAGTYTKSTGSNASWDAQVYSTEGYTKNVYCSARASQTTGYVMFGLNEDTANSSYNTIDYAWFFDQSGVLTIYENGTLVNSYGTYTTSTVLSITYDGSNVQYWKDGVIQRTVARSTGNPLYFDTSFYNLNAAINNVQFGPIGQPFGISGTAGYHPKFTSQQTLGNSIVYDNGTNVGIGTTSTTGKLTIANNGNQLTLKAYDGSQNNTVSFQAIRANYSDAASVLAIYTNSGSSENERVRIMHTGEMGIGTQSPGGMLDVQQSNAGDMLVRAWNTSTAGTGKSIVRIANSGNNAQGQQIQFSDNNYYTGTISSDRTNGLSFYVGQMATPLTSERVRIDTSGNVGVAAGARIGSGTGYINAGATAAGYLELYNATSGATTLMNTGAFNVLVGTNNTERIRVTSSGSIGIGTSTIAGNIPLADLHVNDASGYGSLQLSQSPAGATIDTGGEIQFAATYRSTSDLTQVARIRGLRENATNNNWAGYLAFYTSTGSDNPSASTERMRINSSGNVGIGTTSPSAKLDVVGTSLAVGSIITEVSATYSTASVANSSYALDVYASPSRAHQNQTTYAARIRNSAYNPGGTLYGTNTNGGLYVRCENGNEIGNISYGIKSEVNAGGGSTYGIHASTSGDSHTVTYGGYFSVATGPNAYGIYAESSNTQGIRNSYAGAFKISNNVTGNAYGILVDNASITVGGTYYGCYVSIGSATVTGAKAAGIFTDGTNSATFGNGTYSALFAGGNVGIGNTAPGAKLQVDTGATGTKGQIIKAFLGQSANLSEWQNSTGTVLSQVDSNGYLGVGYNGTMAAIGGYGYVMRTGGNILLPNNSSVGYITNGGTIAGCSIQYTSSDILNISNFQTGGVKFNINTVDRLAITNLTATFTTLNTVGVETTGGANVSFYVKAGTSQTANLQEWRNNSGTSLAYMDANGNFAAVTKSFLIDHPTPAKAAEGKKLRYASLEGPENGVYYRGRLEGESEIVLPDYWKDLVDPESITVNLTARKFAQPSLFVVDANAERVVIESDRQICCDFTVFATRKDVAKLEVEPDGN